MTTLFSSYPSVFPVQTTVKPARVNNPVLGRDFPDPQVLKVGSQYSAYATNTWGVHVQAAVSIDLLEWAYLGDALPVLPSWAVKRPRFT